MSSCIGNVLRLSIFGQSHSAAIGCSLDGLPAGIPVDAERLQRFMDRRAPGARDTSTERREADAVHLIAGVADGHTCGAPLAAIIQNTNTRSRDYAELRRKPRPGHADWPAFERYGNWHDVAGGGHFSGRLTAPLCAAGGVALQALERAGITIAAHIQVLGPAKAGVSEPSFLALSGSAAPVDKISRRDDTFERCGVPMVDGDAAERARELILETKDDLDSVGGIVECGVWGLPAGVGDPMFDGLENRIARIAFGIPAVKGVEFGIGFAAAGLYGSEDNDPYAAAPNGAARPVTNNAGGILGGISTGAPLVWRCAVKPTPSIGQVQHTVDLARGEDAELTVRGRHDPCIVPRAVPVVEAACALALLDALLEDGRYPTPDPRPLAEPAPAGE